jgi:hypothetical protein
LELEGLVDKKNEHLQKKQRLEGTADEEDYLDVPSAEEIEKVMFEYKKKALMDKLAL